MNESWNPEIPLDLQQNFKKEKEQAFTLYLDFVVDATASMYTVFPKEQILSSCTFFRVPVKI